MAQLTLTPKTANYGVLAGLPTADVSTTCSSINPAYFNVAIPPMSPAVSYDEYMMIKVSVQNAVGAAVRTLRLMKADGVTVLVQFPAANQPADPSNATTIYSTRVTVYNPADWVNVTLQVSAGAAGDVVTIKANSLVFAFAESCNVTDEQNVKRNVGTVYFMTMQPTQEALMGRAGMVGSNEFETVPINGLCSGFKWSANSGNTLYSWEGSTIGVGE
jgi:hypothetical protein